MDFLKQTVATAIVTQGDPDFDFWVQTYNIKTSDDDIFFQDIVDNEGNPKVTETLSL